MRHRWRISPSIINVNLIGTYNAARLFAAACAKLEPLAGRRTRGVMVFTSSVAAYDGQVGQQAYSASKAGVVGMTLPMARDLAQHGIRVCTIAPGPVRDTAACKSLPEPVQAVAGCEHPVSGAPGQTRGVRGHWLPTSCTNDPPQRRRPSGSTAHFGWRHDDGPSQFSGIAAARSQCPRRRLTRCPKPSFTRSTCMFGDCDPGRHRFLPEFLQMDGCLLAELLRAMRCAALARPEVKTTWHHRHAATGNPHQIHATLPLTVRRLHDPHQYAGILGVTRSLCTSTSSSVATPCSAKASETRAFVHPPPRTSPERIKAIPVPDDIQVPCATDGGATRPIPHPVFFNPPLSRRQP
jgi:hypothetical protein